MSVKSISTPIEPKFIGSYEAKTHLPQLLRQVQAGEVFEISIRGQAVARLVPVPPVLAPEEKRQSAVSRMRAFMQAQRAAGAGAGIDLREMLDDGRA